MSRFAPHPTRRPAVVTGASSGIGAATAHALAASGHPVVLGARREQACKEVAAAITADGGEAVALPLDLGEETSVDEFAAAALDVFGGIEVVVSNAAQIWPGTALETTSEAFTGLLGVNLVGAHRLVRAFAPAMVERRRGDIVFVTSDVVDHPRPAMVAYLASKWGLEGYIQALQMEWEGTGVRASVVRPGPTHTGMGMDWDPQVTQQVLGEWVRWGLARHPHFLSPRSVADAVVSAVSVDPGTHLAIVTVQPEGPPPRAKRPADERPPGAGTRPPRGGS